ncbi:hypothetical protein EVAR_20319_1 [Eumeta japonica]|uniref:Ileal sodium/bile acid cotransporter n=1 Tax=Eumeta variegata TaxID=151549 RepID=A0A4C1VQT6_EUMVA|nr:hypothetical protein EVAR_20319_1 [Eumeta japonica]
MPPLQRHARRTPHTHRLHTHPARHAAHTHPARARTHTTHTHTCRRIARTHHARRTHACTPHTTYTHQASHRQARTHAHHTRTRAYTRTRRTEIVTEVVRGSEVHLAEGVITVNVTRPERIIDTIFTTSVATFVSLIFINFGCAMHWPTVKEVVKKPIGPAIGMVGQFLFMPLCSFGLGYLIFRDDSLTAAALRLGMFCTGVSPGGGASNIWTFILGGNLNLSLAMTSMSTLASFAFMPMWLFSLGQVIFRDARIVVPYTRIASFVVGLIVPMAIGLGMQRWTPRLAAFMVRILKGFSSLLLLFIIVFAIITNLYIFELFTWEPEREAEFQFVTCAVRGAQSPSKALARLIIVAGMGLPWLGYLFGYVFARALKQPHPDALAISIETGVQNTGIAIFLLRFALPQPDADLTTVVPVSVAIMTPVPMMTIFAYQKIKGCITGRNKHKKIVEEDNTPIPDTPEPISVATIAIEKEN